MDQVRIKEIDGLAENYFEKLCIRSRLTRTRPGKDENGWDWFLEFPQNRIVGLDLDAQPAPIKCLVQVKATDSLKNLTMKVSNFEHLARAQMPAFIFVAEFCGGQEPKKVFLCHFGEDRITQTLKKIREMEAGGDKDLHKTKMTFPVLGSERLTLEENANFAEELVKYTGKNLSDYIKWKSKLLESIGFDERHLIFSPIGGISVSDFIAAFIHGAPVKVLGARVSNRRFGIDLEKFQIGSGEMTITPTLGSVPSCTMIASTSKPARRVSINASIIAPPIINLSNNIIAFKAYNSFFTFLYASNESNFEFRIDPASPCSFEELFDSVKFVNVLAGKDPKIEFFVGTQCFGVATFSRPRFDNFYGALLSRLEMVKKFLHEIDWREPLTLCANDLFDDSFGDIGLICGPSPNSVSFNDFSLSVEPSELRKSLRKKGVVGLAIPVRFVSGYFVVFCWWRSKIELKDNKFNAELLQCEIWDKRFYTRDDEKGLKQLYGEFTKFCQGIGPVAITYGLVQKFSQAQSPSPEDQA